MKVFIVVLTNTDMEKAKEELDDQGFFTPTMENSEVIEKLINYHEIPCEVKEIK